MSIFDVIRYPISDYPTPEELVALPPNLFDYWKSLTEWRDPTLYQSPTDISEWYQSYRRSPMLRSPMLQRSANEIKLLRKIIIEWDDNESL